MIGYVSPLETVPPKAYHLKNEAGMSKNTLQKRLDTWWGDRPNDDPWVGLCRQLLARPGQYYTLPELRDLAAILLSSSEECVLETPSQEHEPWQVMQATNSLRRYWQAQVTLCQLADQEQGLRSTRMTFSHISDEVRARCERINVVVEEHSIVFPYDIRVETQGRFTYYYLPTSHDLFEGNSEGDLRLAHKSIRRGVTQQIATMQPWVIGRHP